ncbi:MAG TPA: gliding motility-associated C-terminal domain-containing protein [Flavisolibacter sp.]|nr:gliding motility-associated C-terminal domain-containing protein [Flavisolibacter sp.]
MFIKTVNGQGQDNTWYFGNKAGLHFTAGGPVPLLDGNLISDEGSASISDAAGNLLFYSEGTRVWNRNHAIMPNGAGLLGNPSTSQSALIVQVPGSSTRYYLFTLEDQTTTGRLFYSIIDMSLAGGMGDVDPAFKNIQLADAQTEMLAAANSTNCGIWVISHRRNSDIFEARLVNASGLSAPVLSSAGGILNNGPGVLKVSRDNLRLAMASSLGRFCQLVDFNPATGQVSGGFSLPSTTGFLPYGVSFSPNDKRLYSTEGNLSNIFTIYQYDLSLPTAADIAASKTVVSAVGIQTSAWGLCDMALGPDGRIYATRLGMNCLAVINNPNAPAASCDFVENGICLGGRISNVGLPNEVRSLNKVLDLALGNDTALCAGSSLLLTAPSAAGGVLWSTGETTPAITVLTDGKYWVRIWDNECVISDTIEVSFSGTKPSLGNDTALCEGSSFLLKTDKPFTSYTWQDNSTQADLTVTAPGLYWVEVVNECGLAVRDSVVVTGKYFTVNAGPDRVRCGAEELRLQAPPGFISYSWSPGYGLNQTTGESVTAVPLVDTAYVLKAEKEPGCFAVDTLRIRVLEVPELNLGVDTSICPGSTLELRAPAGFASYAWNNGSTTSFTVVRQEGSIWLTATAASGCSVRDSLAVSWKDCPVQFWMPGAFTPNGDGRNDRFKALYQGLLEKFELRIYNRWGQEIFVSRDPEQAWDGSLKGNALDTGVFPWICNYQFFGQPPVMTRGIVTLIR